MLAKIHALALALPPNGFRVVIYKTIFLHRLRFHLVMQALIQLMHASNTILIIFLVVLQFIRFNYRINGCVTLLHSSYSIAIVCLPLSVGVYVFGCYCKAPLIATSKWMQNFRSSQLFSRSLFNTRHAIGDPLNITNAQQQNHAHTHTFTRNSKLFEAYCSRKFLAKLKHLLTYGGAWFWCIF